MRHVVYGPGGFDPAKPNGNVMEEFDVPDPQIGGGFSDDRLVTLLEELAKATTLAQVRAAATKAAEG